MFKNNPTVCIVIPYFGQWPFWINLFIESCRYNPTINWLMFTDCGFIDNCPKNVQVNNISFNDYCQLVSNKLAIKFSPLKPYKLCDIRPAYGLIHAIDLNGYDFWGFGDIDLIYGNLRHFLTNERLANKDVFSNHSTRTSGHLCLIRNVDDLRVAFKKIPNWQQKFSAQQHLAIDEKDFSKLFIRHKNSPHILKSIAQFFDPMLKRADLTEAYSTPNARIAWVDGSYNFPKKWIWQKGILTNDLDGTMQFMYFHFFVWKNAWNKNENKILLNANKNIFSITEYGFEYL